MSSLLLVRHAQASFLEADYDRLSELGHEQARWLGEHWARLGWSLDAVLVGPRRRHLETAERVLSELERHGLGVSAPIVSEELDEYPAEAVLRARLSGLSERGDVASLLAEAGSSERSTRGRALDRLLQLALSEWALEPEGHAVDHESWGAFARRVERALDTVLARPGRGERIAVFSSAGTIGAIVARVLRAEPPTALELGWTLNNSSVTEVWFSPGRATLSRFNAVAHLSDPTHWTRR